MCTWVDPPLPTACKCDNNQMIFKGIVARYLMYTRDYLAALAAREAREASVSGGAGRLTTGGGGTAAAAASAIDAFLRLNANVAWESARNSVGDFGIFWQGPVFGAVPANTANTNQAVLDLLVATVHATF